MHCLFTVYLLCCCTVMRINIIKYLRSHKVSPEMHRISDQVHRHQQTSARQKDSLASLWSIQSKQGKKQSWEGWSTGIRRHSVSTRDKPGRETCTNSVLTQLFRPLLENRQWWKGLSCSKWRHAFYDCPTLCAIAIDTKPKLKNASDVRKHEV